MSKLAITKFRGAKRPDGKRYNLTWPQLVEMFTEARIYDTKEQMPLFSATEFKNDYRERKNAGKVHAIIVEHDAGEISIDHAAEVLQNAGVTAALYTTPSHTSDSPRFRIIAKLSRPVEEADHSHYVRVLNHLLDGAIAAESDEHSRAWYYGRLDGAEYECRITTGLSLNIADGVEFESEERPLRGGHDKKEHGEDDLDDILGRVIPKAEPPTKEAAERIRSALEASRVDPDAQYLGNTGRGPMCWRDVVFALHSTQHPDAREICMEWSKLATKRKFDQAEFDRFWDSITIDRSSTTTFATIVHHAKKNDWVDPWSVNKDIMDSYGDLANGQRFAAKHRGEFLYVVGAKEWVRWDGLRWKWCTGEEISAGKKIAIDCLREAAEKKASRGSEVDKANYTMANKIASEIRRVSSMLTSAWSEPGMSVADQSLFDRDAFLLGVKNGVVNLRNGELLQARQSMLISKQANCRFDTDATCPRFLKFLDDIFLGDQEKIDFIKRAVGMALIGKMLSETMFFMLGSGANGKSVFANILHSIFGDYVVTMNASVLMRDKFGSSAESTREKARLHGMRLVLMNELESDDIFSEKTLKDMVSTEVITARNLYEASFQFMPTHTIFLRGNHLPGVKDTTDGFWRRIALIEFKRQYSEKEKIPDLADVILEKERDGIFAWMVQGCIDVQDRGLDAPKSVTDLNKKYRKDSDLVGEWLECNCNKKAGAKVPLSLLYRSYSEHILASGSRPMSQLRLKKDLAERGFHSIRAASVQTVVGLDLHNGDDWGDLNNEEM